MGYELLSGKGNMPPPPLKVRLEESATAGSAFQTVARACLQQLLSNKTSALVGDREALHHMRIALRRLRAAISVFSRVVTDGQTPRIKSGASMDSASARTCAGCRRVHCGRAGSTARSRPARSRSESTTPRF